MAPDTKISGLTEAKIRDAKPEATTRILWDHAVRGLGVRVTPAGAKSFVIQYRTKGRQRRWTLAQCAAISLKRARERAGEQLLSIRNGSDPLQQRQDAQAAPSVASAIDRFFREDGPALVAAGRMRATTLQTYSAQAERHVKRGIGPIKVEDVKRSDVVNMLAKIAGGIQRNRVQALVSRLFTAFEGWEIRAPGSNPAKGIGKVREHPRTRIFSPGELKAMGGAIGEIECPSHRAALQFLILTGWRVGEILGLEWTMVNLETGVCDLPSTKTGPSRRPVSAIALQVLDGLPRGGARVFAVVSYRTLRGRLLAACRAAGIEDARLHDCRRTFASTAAADGMSAFMLQGLLGHASIAMSARYVQLSGPVLDEARQATTSHMSAMLKGTSAEVVDHPARGKGWISKRRIGS